MRGRSIKLRWESEVGWEASYRGSRRSDTAAGCLGRGCGSVGLHCRSRLSRQHQVSHLGGDVGVGVGRPASLCGRCTGRSPCGAESAEWSRRSGHVGRDRGLMDVGDGARRHFRMRRAGERGCDRFFGRGGWGGRVERTLLLVWGGHGHFCLAACLFLACQSMRCRRG